MLSQKERSPPVPSAKYTESKCQGAMGKLLFVLQKISRQLSETDFLFCQNLSSSTNLQMRGRPASERDRFYYFTSHDLKEYANQQNLSSLLKCELSGRRPPKYISFFMRQSNSEGRGFVPRDAA